MTLPADIEAIAIGTSAGGIEALSQLLPALPPTLEASIFIVVHLPRERPSLLVSIFQDRCPIPVREAEDKEPILPGTVYFAPPDYHLLVDSGPSLALSADEPVNFSRPSIDVLFESAADAYGKRLLGMVLTGGSSDGSAGLACIRAAGGTTIVQDPEEAKVPLMVTAALARTPADYILPLTGISALLGSLAVPGRGT